MFLKHLGVSKYGRLPPVIMHFHGISFFSTIHRGTPMTSWKPPNFPIWFPKFPVSLAMWISVKAGPLVFRKDRMSASSAPVNPSGGLVCLQGHGGDGGFMLGSSGKGNQQHFEVSCNRGTSSYHPNFERWGLPQHKPSSYSWVPPWRAERLEIGSLHLTTWEVFFIRMTWGTSSHHPDFSGFSLINQPLRGSPPYGNPMFRAGES